jgi:predicted dehydrogenase
MGELMFLRARYGHGGRVGYDKEWRADPKLSGGGELIDQGIHLIDLAGWFLGGFKKLKVMRQPVFGRCRWTTMRF